MKFLMLGAGRKKGTSLINRLGKLHSRYDPAGSTIEFPRGSGDPNDGGGGGPGEEYVGCYDAWNRLKRVKLESSVNRMEGGLTLGLG